MKFRTLLMLICTTIMVVGCAHQPPTYATASGAAPERLLAYQTKDDESISTLVLIRGYGFMGGGCYIGVNINETLVARLDLGEAARFYVKPGKQVIDLVVDPLGRGSCGFWQGTNLGSHTTFLEKGERKSFRFNMQEFDLLDE